MIFLPKTVRPKSFQQFRGISLLSVMSKWYAQCLYILAKRCPKPALYHNICIYSYESCLDTRYVTTALQILMSRGMEWHNRMPTYVFNGEIHAAFDNMKPATIAKALQGAGLHPRLVAAMIAETVGLKCCPRFAGLPVDQPIPFNKCARQGGVESAYEWNSVMMMCLSKLVPLWYESGYGVDLADGRRYTHAVWADNIWLMSHD